MAVVIEPGIAEPTARTASSHFLIRAVKRPAGIVSLGWLLLVIGGCLLASWVAPYDPLTQDLGQAYAGPSGAHWLGADQLGRDILSRLLHGGRTSLSVTAIAVVVYLVLGVLLGVVAGYLGGWADRALMRIADLFQAMPAIIVLLVVLGIYSHNEIAAMIALGALASAGLARVVRVATQSVRSEAFVASAQVSGLGRTTIVRRHILPQVAGPVIVLASILASSALLVETALNFLGLGVQPPAPSWGGLIGDASQAIYRQPWMLVPSGAIVIATAVALGVLGDVVRDASADRSAAGALSWRRMRTAVRPTQAAPQGTSSRKADLAALLTVRGLRVTLPSPAGRVTIVDDFDIDVRPGEIVGLVGESGCGKTMAISAIMRLLPAGGELGAEEIRLGDIDLLGLSEKQMGAVRGRRIGMISQEPIGSLDPAYTVAAQLTECIRNRHDMSRAQAGRRALELLESVGLPDPATVLAKYPHELSGGMAQRVSIARALAGEPDLLIADEPTTALDVTVQAGILDLLRELCRERGMALIIVTHDWGVVADLCSRAIVMYAGQAIERAGVAELFAGPRHPYTAALLAAEPRGHARDSRLPAIPGSVAAPGSWPVGCRFAARCERASADCSAAPVELVLTAGAEFRCLHPLPVADREVARVD